MFYRFEIGQGITKCRLRIILSQKRSMTQLQATQILGVEQNSSRKEIKKAYIELAKLYHPDSKVIQRQSPIQVSHATFRLAAINDFVKCKRQMKFYCEGQSIDHGILLITTQ